MLGIVILTSLSVIVVAIVFVALICAAVLDGREQSRVEGRVGTPVAAVTPPVVRRAHAKAAVTPVGSWRASSFTPSRTAALR